MINLNRQLTTESENLVKPTEVVAQRRELLDSCYRALRGEVAMPAPWDSDAEHDTLMRGCADLAGMLDGGEAVFVAGDMAAVAAAASGTLPIRDLAETVIPAPSGLMLIEGGLGRFAVDEQWSPLIGGVAWLALRTDGHGLVDGQPSYAFHNGKDGPLREPLRNSTVVEFIPLIDMTEHGHPGRLVAPSEGFRMGWQIGSGVGAPNGSSPAGADLIRAGKTIVTAWALMGQPISVAGREVADRAERRRCERAAAPSDCVVVRLRRLAADSAGSGAGPVEWSHRWLVSGHWTRQPYGPGRSLRRPTWISPYVKGPADKPLIVKDKVTAWVR
jgi:hypothetical protein